MRYKIHKLLNRVRLLLGLMSVPAPWIKEKGIELSRLQEKRVTESIRTKSYERQLTSDKIKEHNRMIVLKFLGSLYLILQILIALKELL